jgi:ABC-2 type transport system permease protein
VEVDIDLVALLCPLVNYMGNIPVMSSFDMELDAYVIIYDSTGWVNLAVMAAVGVAFGVVALLLYRRRQLECAGEFMAVKVLNPVFLVIYSLVVAAVFHGMCVLFMDGESWIFLLIGLAVGYFTGQMLLKRTTRVFGMRQLRGFAVLALCFALSFVVTFLDPLNITGWVPEAEKVSAVMINNKELTDPALVEQVILFHEEVTKEYDGYENHSDKRLTLAYRMKSGRIVRRAYWVDIDSVAGELLRPVVSSPEFVLEGLYPDVDYAQKNFSIQILNEYYEHVAPKDRQGLMDCLILDCKEGNLPQNWWIWNDVEP